MNAIRSFTVLLCVFFQSITYAQLQQIPLNVKIEKSSTVVEGEVVLSQSYENEGKIYTAHLIKVYQILKTNTEVEPFVTVITLGGELGNKKVEWSHLLTLDLGNKGIFCLIPSNRPSTDDARFTGRNYNVYSSGQGFLQYVDNRGKKVVKDFIREYDNQERLFDRITEITGKIPQQVNEKKKCIVISIEPAEVTPAFGQIGFDIKVRSLEGEFKLYQSLVSVKYDTDFFGSNIVSSEILSWEESGISLSDDYLLNATDFAEDILRVQLNFSGNPDSLFTLSTEKVKIGSFVVDLSTLEGEPSFEFDYELMEQENLYFDEEAERGRPFRCIKIENELFKPPCPVITDFAPKTAAAGVGTMSESGVPGVITITGENFGAPASGSTIQKPDNYRVGFRNAGEGNFYVYPPARDYISWTENEIQVRVPSLGETGNPIEYAGTGHVLVTKTDEETCLGTSDVELNVPFCVINGVFGFTGGTFKSAPVKLADVNEEGGYNILLEDSFLELADSSKAAFIRALETWQCGVKVNFVEKDIDDISEFNFLCTVSARDSLPAGVTSTLAVTTLSPIDCDTTRVFLPKWDMIFNKFAEDSLGNSFEIDWYTDEGEIPPAQDTLPNISLEGVALHELGHALLLRHVRNDDKVMRQGVHRISLTTDDANGGKHVVKISIVESHCQTPMREYECLLDNNANINRSKLQTYPNPVNNSIFIELENHFNGAIQIHNSIGQLIRKEEVAAHTENIKLDVSNLQAGIYYISLVDENSLLATIKIIKL